MSKWGGKRVPLLRRAVIDTYGRVCWLCHQPIDGTVSVDHVLPRSKGGTDDIENLRPAHLRCNLRRGNRAPRITRPLRPSTDW